MRRGLLRILATFTVVFFVISILAGFFMHSRGLDLPFGHPSVVEAVFSIFYEIDTVRTYNFWLLVVLVTNITCSLTKNTDQVSFATSCWDAISGLGERSAYLLKTVANFINKRNW